LLPPADREASVPDTDQDGIAPGKLQEVLVAARDAGFLGPGPIERHLRHARGFVDLGRTEAAAEGENPRILDLGSGGGLPGLVVAGAWPEATVVLLEANERRSQFLERAVAACNLQERVNVVHQRAEIAGRDPLYRATFDGVVVRSFGSPAVVAECAAPLLRVGGWLVVSEPPGEDGAAAFGADSGADQADNEADLRRAITEEIGRWPADKLEPVGLEPVKSVRTEFGYQILRQVRLCPDRFPRRNGVPSKRPLF
jgi:16S rRNA (guanine527-N7)-methyltransferase